MKNFISPFFIINLKKNKEKDSKQESLANKNSVHYRRDLDSIG